MARACLDDTIFMLPGPGSSKTVSPIWKSGNLGEKSTFFSIAKEIAMRLGRTEIDLLQALSRGESPRISSPQRLRLELMGLVVDCASGLVLTPAGRTAARTATPTAHEEFVKPNRPLDAAGRKRMLDRVVPGV